MRRISQVTRRKSLSARRRSRTRRRDLRSEEEEPRAEKFKFVLDYKIKELKRQIEPRENEIADMAQQIKEMDQELEQYHKSNAALDLMIGELRLKMEGMQKEADQQKRQITLGDEWMARACAELQEVMPNIDSKKSLKSSVTRLYKKYVQEDLAAKAAGESDVQKEYNRQREYLEKSVESLKRKLAKDMELHSNENMRLMRESVTLTKEINELRRELRMAKMLLGQVVSQMEPQPPPSSAGSLRRKPQLSSEPNEGNVSSTDAERELEMQQQHLSRLRSHIARLEDAIGGPLSTRRKLKSLRLIGASTSE